MILKTNNNIRNTTLILLLTAHSMAHVTSITREFVRIAGSAAKLESPTEQTPRKSNRDSKQYSNLS